MGRRLVLESGRRNTRKKYSRVTKRRILYKKYGIKRQSQSEQNKSAITDHVNTKNHVINCDEATMGRESDRTTQWIREADKIRQESQGVLNRDEGPTS